jgi:hypothetical protein
MALVVSIDLYDRWDDAAENCRRLRAALPGCRILVHHGGEPPEGWSPDADLVRRVAAGRGLGHRAAWAAATDCVDDGDAVVAMSAKCFLTDPTVLARWESDLAGHDAAFLERLGDFEGRAEVVCLFMARGRAWRGRMTSERLGGASDEWNEVIVAGLWQDADVVRVPYEGWTKVDTGNNPSQFVISGLRGEPGRDLVYVEPVCAALRVPLFGP